MLIPTQLLMGCVDYNDEAKAILADLNADQNTIDTSFYRLAHAIQMLDFIKGDKTELEALLNSLEEYKEALLSVPGTSGVPPFHRL